MVFLNLPALEVRTSADKIRSNVEAIIICGTLLIHEISPIIGQFVTSQGPGTAFDFGLALVEKLVSSEKRASTAKAMLLQ